MSEFVVGDDGVLSWSRPVPPNGDILYYNVIITRADTALLEMGCSITPHILAKTCRGVDIHPKGVKMHSAGAKLHSTGCLITP